MAGGTKSVDSRINKDDGSVYGLDNLRVITPKRHIEIHSNKEEK
ncbi:hypothetical protein [Photorhabdus hainanensis]